MLLPCKSHTTAQFGHFLQKSYHNAAPHLQAPYLARGGKITKLGETAPAPDSLRFEIPMQHAVLHTVSWRELEQQADYEIDDPQYWKKLNAKLDAVLKRNKKDAKRKKLFGMK